MSLTPEFIIASSTVLGMAVAFVVWLIRLEGKTDRINERCANNERATEKLEVKHDALDNKIVDKLSSIEKSLAKIQGKLSIDDEDK